MKSGFLRKIFAAVLTMCIAFSSFGMAIAAAAGPSDIQGSWAAKVLGEWVAKGWLKGYPDGSVKPDNNVTRAEFFTLVNNALGLTEKAKISFSDVKAGDWEYDQVSKAEMAGYIKGYEDGTVRPSDFVTRQEVAVMAAAILKLKGAPEGSVKFKDAANIAVWSKGAVGTLAALGVLNGYPDGTFQPEKSITRAEAVVAINTAVQAYVKMNSKTYDKAGTYGPETGFDIIAGNITVAASGVTLQNMTIMGDLIIDEAVGDGDVTIKKVTVKGNTIVRGGGKNSIHFVDSVLVTITVDKKTGTVRIVAEGATSVQTVTLTSSAVVEESGVTGTGFSLVQLSESLPEGSNVQLLGSFDQVDVNAANIKIDIPKGSVENLNVSEGAEGSSVNLSAGATIVKLVLDAVAKLLGQGTIENATLNDGAKGATFEKKPNQTNGSQGGNVVVVPPPTSTSGGGGGSSGGGDIPASQTAPTLSGVTGIEAGSVAGTTRVMTLPTLPNGAHHFEYKVSVDNNAIPRPNVGVTFSGTTFTAGRGITAANNKHIGIAAVDSSSKVVQFVDVVAVTTVANIGSGTEEELDEALANVDVQTIKFDEDVDLVDGTAYLQIDRPVTINGQNHALNKGIAIEADDVTISNLNITPSKFYRDQDFDWYYGIMVGGVEGVKIKDSIITGTDNTDAIGISDKTGSQGTNFTVDGVTISNVWLGIIVDSPNTTAELNNNIISDAKHAIMLEHANLTKVNGVGNKISNPKMLGDLVTEGDGITLPVGSETAVAIILANNEFTNVKVGNEVVVAYPSEISVQITLGALETTVTFDDVGVVSTTDFDVVVTHPLGADPSVTWSSSDESIATVDANGLVMPKVVVGTADIIATSVEDPTKSDRVTITVKKAPNAPSVTADDDANIVLGADATMEYTTNVNGGWTAYDPASPPSFTGNTTVYVRIAENGETPTGRIITLTFTDASIVDSIIISAPAELAYSNDGRNDSATLDVQVLPFSTADQTVTWSSSKPTVATVDTNTGVVTAVSAGTVDITATSVADPSITDTVTITVKLAPDKPDVSVDDDNDVIVGADTTMEWSTDFVGWTPYDAATIAPFTGNINVVVRVAANGGIPAGNPTILSFHGAVAVTGISITSNGAQTNNLEVDDDLQLDAVISPADASNNTVIWESGDTNIATVDSSGLVHAVGAGTVTISVVSNDNPDFMATAIVVVVDKQALLDQVAAARVMYNDSAIAEGDASGQYSTATLQALQDAIFAAQVVASARHTQEDVDQAVANLQVAMDAFMPNP